MTTFTNIDGRLLPSSEAGIFAANRGLRYGYGIFETMLVVDGTIRLEELHWARVSESLTLLKIESARFFLKTLKEEVIRSVSKNKFSTLCRVRLQINAGSGGLFDDSPFKANYMIECFSVDPQLREYNEAGLTIGVCDIVKHADKYANLKSCSALSYALAARAAKANRWNDAVLLNADQCLVETSIANLFWVKDGIVYTPSLDTGCVAGVMRQHLLNTLPNQGFTCVTTVAKAVALQDAEEVFLTNAVRGIRWIRSLGNKNYDHSISLKIYNESIKPSLS